ncbi:MAG: OsmC family protein [Anaerolineae bacterium]|jgi:putative redox protein|nr:OsmC family protein [Anaerolineae bacterium]MBT3711765.1 OsmC family protein [Anaerolineae bacterium]MBT4308815.1 OsmC family protein [Anaerolineae bacterium]MBT4459706.1 OsmC family protein [Anaerolineae bacterium]MBT6059851.1 OsmC family protein [Anaerolineae bacterium]
MATNIKVTWKKENVFSAENEAGGKAELGGINIRPMQMILASLAGCTGVDVVNILKKKRVNFKDIEIKVSGKRADTHPKVYTDIHVTYLIWGEGIKEKDVEQAIKLSEDKYCSVSAMLKSTAKIHSDYKIFGEKND